MQTKLRVALLATIVDFGGIEQVLLTLLRNIGQEIELVPILFTNEAARKGSFFECADVLHVPYETLELNTSKSKYLNPLRNIRETVARVRNKGFDLIHTHGYRADVIGIIVAKYCSIPIISTCHGFISIDRQLSIYNRLDIFLLRYFDKIIAVSDRMKMDLVERGVSGRKVEVIANAVSCEPRSDSLRARQESRSGLGIREEEFVFGFVGRLSEEKGLNYLIEALNRWTPKSDRFRLVVVGKGPEREALEQTVLQLGLADKVVFVGFQSDVSAWYPLMDAFVLPSLTEGTPMVLLEAMALGIPVIATSVGGVPAVVSNGENGILVMPADPSELMEAMKAVASKTDLRRRISKKAKDLVLREYNVDLWIRKVTEIYVSTSAQRSGR